MKRIYNWLKSWFVAAKVSRELSGTNQLLGSLEAERRNVERRLDQRERELTAIEKRLRTDLEDAKRTSRRYESSLEELREKNHVLEVTIQTLVASHKLLMERYDTEASIEVRRRVAVSARE